jgi:hypothetical protein
VCVDTGAASDFENWSPLGDKCLLGEQFTYQRRKQDSVCVVSDDHQPSHKIQTCPCVEEDYEWYHSTHTTHTHTPLTQLLS